MHLTKVCPQLSLSKTGFCKCQHGTSLGDHLSKLELITNISPKMLSTAESTKDTSSCQRRSQNGDNLFSLLGTVQSIVFSLGTPTQPD